MAKSDKNVIFAPFSF